MYSFGTRIKVNRKTLYFEESSPTLECCNQRAFTGTCGSNYEKYGGRAAIAYTHNGGPSTVVHQPSDTPAVLWTGLFAVQQWLYGLQYRRDIIPRIAMEEFQ